MDEIQIEDKSQLAEVFEHLDKDEVSGNTLMSSIDFNTRLTRDEIKLIMIIDELLNLGILPSQVTLTRQLKRLLVSHEGQGRKEKVAIASAEINRESGGLLSGLFNRRQE